MAESSDAIQDPEVFDAYQSLLKHSDMVPGSIMSKLLDSISSGLLAELEATIRDIETGDQRTFMAHKTPLEMYAFLLHWFVTAAERVKASDDGEVPAAPVPKARKGKGGKAATGRGTGRSTTKKNEAWTWQEQIPPTLALISKVLRLQSQRIWPTTAERDTFMKYVFLHVPTILHPETT